MEQYLENISNMLMIIAACALTWTIYLVLCAFDNKLKEWKEKKSSSQKINNNQK